MSALSRWTLAVLLLSSTLSAQVAPRSLPDDGTRWLLETSTTTVGLPQNTVNAIAQDPDGVLWFATFGGLGRFDGVRIAPVTITEAPELRSNRVLALHAGRSGRLWVGTDCGVASVFHGVVRQHDLRSDRLPVCVNAVVEDAYGNLWAATPEGLRCLPANGDHVLPPCGPRGATALRLTRDGHVCAIAGDGLWRREGDAWQLWPCAPLALLPFGDDRLLVGCYDGLFEFTGSRLQRCAAIAERDAVHALAQSIDGAIWVACTSGLFRVTDLAHATPPAGSPTEAGILSLFEDREGSLWVGSSGQGLTQCRRAVLRSLGTGSADTIAARAAGGAWIGINDLLRRVDERGTVVASQHIGRPITTMLPDGSDGLWLGLANELHHCDGDAPPRALAAFDRVRYGDVAALCDDPAGLWLGFLGGRIGRWRTGGFEPCDNWPLVGRAITRMLRAADGSIWVGTQDGVARTDDGGRTWSAWGVADGAPAGEIRGIAQDNSGAIWLGSYGGGLVRWEHGRFARIDRGHGLPSDTICELRHDASSDRLLIVTNIGLFTCQCVELRGVCDEALPSVGCRQLLPASHQDIEGNGWRTPCSAETVDHRFWFLTLADVTLLEPGNDHTDDQTVRCVVDEVRSGDRTLHDGESPVESSQRHLHLRWTAPSTARTDQLRFRHRLIGVDRDWVLDGPRCEANWFDLPAGDFTFELQAAKANGVWGPLTTRTFRFPRRLYEQPLAIAAALLAVALAIASFVRLLGRRSERRRRQLEHLVDERTADLALEVRLRRAYEDQLVLAQTNLETKVRQRTLELRRSLNRMRADQSRRESLERQVQQLQRLESVGNLAGGIAHDFNNLLTVVLGSCELLERSEDADADTRELVHGIRDAGQRGRRLTQQLLTFASKQAVHHEVLDFGQLARDLTRMLARVLGDSVRLTVRTPGDPVLVEADRAQLEQVLLNLCVNSRDAMPDGGELTVTVEAVAGTPAPGTCILRVTDTGCGMPPAVRERACEPFFSTKHRSKNSGLGLATCYGIVKRLDGDLQIESAVGNGTTVTIQLPCTARALAPADPLVPRPSQIDGTVLLIEDDEAVRRAIARMLESMGAEVITASDGDDGVDRLRLALGRIDMVVSDVVMPGLQGIDLVDSLRALRPGLPIVFLSGYADLDGPCARLHEHGFEVLPKPVEPPLLAAALWRAREQAKGTAADEPSTTAITATPV